MSAHIVLQVNLSSARFKELMLDFLFHCAMCARVRECTMVCFCLLALFCSPNLESHPKPELPTSIGHIGGPSLGDLQ